MQIGKSVRMLRNIAYLAMFLFALSLHASLPPCDKECEPNAYDPVALYLTWQRSPTSTMTVHWITDLKREDDRVEYRMEGSDVWHFVQGSHILMPRDAPFLIHTAELTNLQPATDYWFRVGQDALSYKFQTMPLELDQPIHFVVGGDMYHDTLDILHEMNREAAKTAPSFVLVGGDIAYAADKTVGFLPRWTHGFIDVMVGQKPDRWLEWLIAWKEDMVTPEGRLIPMLPVLGNHDTSGRFGRSAADAPFFYALFSMPGEKGYNVLDFGNYMSVLLLDSGHTNPVGGAQAKWVAETLGQRKLVAYTFAVYHVPAFPSVRKIDDEYCKEVRTHWTPLFEEGRLTAAFEHHDHCYKRTYPIKKGKIDRDGVVYLGDGSWGVEKPRKVRRRAEKWYLAEAASERHFLKITLDQGRCRSAAINAKGNIIDQFEW